MSQLIDEHRQYLEDPHRMAAFERAIAAVVRPGDVVLDLAAGTGILGLLACRAGAARVYAVDEGPIIQIARDLAAANGYADRVTHIRRLSAWLELPERVDAIVCDQVGGFGFEAGIFEDLPDARARFLKPDGRIVPGRVRLWLAPCEFAEGRAWVDFWASPVAQFDVSPVHPMASASGYPCRFAADHLLAPGEPIADLDMSTAEDGLISATLVFTVRRPARLDGLAGWMSAELAPGIEMTNSPDAPDRINRRQTFLPLDPVQLTSGTQLHVEIRILPTEAMVQWHLRALDAGGATISEQRHSTFAGMLISAEDLARTSPHGHPRLSRAGHARRVVLELTDGNRSVAEIERAIAEQFPDIVRDQTAATRFVAQVLTVYAE